MPDDSKKNQQKSKHDPKDQRKSRRTRQQAPVEKKEETKVEKPHYERKAGDPRVPEKPPVYEDPGPEFYKNLKRESDEILKITEEANSKYKNKEIQSNWSKYEVPIKSYDEVEEEENLGADYEKLVQAPQSIGGHFQFKHEKSWDITTGPSLYDKYFEINMENLSTALSTIPFYERNSIEHSVFSQSDLQTMNSRSIRYKQKYFNDKSYTTPELDAQEKMLRLMMLKNDSNCEVEADRDIKEMRSISESKMFEDCGNINTETEAEGTGKIIEVDSLGRVAADELSRPEDKGHIIIHKVHKPLPEKYDNKAHGDDELDDLILGNVDSKVDTSMKNVDVEVKNTVHVERHLLQVAESAGKNSTRQPQEIIEPESNSVIETPEDLEKWLDDFLDG